MVCSYWEEHRWSSLDGWVCTVEFGIAGSVDGFDVFDIFGGALVAGRLQLFFTFGPVLVFVYL